MASVDSDRLHLVPRDDGARSCRVSKHGCAQGTGIGLGIALVGVAISIAVGFPIIFHKLVTSMLPIVNGSVTYDAWATPTASTPIYMQFWLFNVTNGAEFLMGAKPAVEQVGPFTYQEERRKASISAYGNSTLSYREYRWFHFRPDMSCCPESSEITSVNLAYFTLISLVRYRIELVHRAIEDFFVATKNPPIVTHTVKELLWGYTDPTLEFAAKIAHIIGFKLEPNVGLFYGKNGTDDGQYLIFSGQADVSQLAQIDRWQGNMTLSTWSTQQANMINGSDGTLFPPFVDSAKPLYIYSTDICRSIYVTYTNPTSVKGIDLLRFQAPAEVFQNATVNPANIGFCLNGVCLDSGVLNLSTCQPGVPAVTSQPHFYQGAAQYIDAVVGLQPGPDYATVLDVEPNTGLVMRASKKLQINLAVASARGFYSSQAVVPLFMPLLWVNESATIDDASAAQFRDSVLLPVRLATAVEWASLGIGLFCLAAASLACALAAHRRRRELRAADDGYPEIGGSVQHVDAAGYAGLKA